MRDKNIFTELPVEDLPEDDHNSEIDHIEKFRALSISKMANKRNENKSTNDRNEIASINHKKVTGANNWKVFLEKNKTNRKEIEKDDLILNMDSNGENTTKRKSNNIVAIDCEMVGVGEGGKENMLARVSIVNALGECLYDTFVKPTAPVTDYRTAVSGVRSCDLVNAERFSAVQKKVLELIRGKLLIGHAVYNDLIVLKIRHPRQDIRDTTRFKKFYSISAGTPSLKKLTAHFLKVDIQCGEHSSVQDAQAAMQLYMLFRKEWEADLKKRRHMAYHHHHHQTKKRAKTSYKPKRFGKNYKK